VALFILGYAGVIFGAIIQAAISRQREFLADASAVQFTRTPAGIAGALKKIGCPTVGSNITDFHAAEVSHLFFGNACGLFSLGKMLATHPDLITRIKRIDPYFDGRFPKRIEPQRFNDKPPRSKIQTTTGSKQSVMNHIGELDLANVLAAGALLRAIPQGVAFSASNPLTAQAVFFAMLLDTDETIRQKQIRQIQGACSIFLLQETQRLYPAIRSLPEEEKIPLAQRVSATLREMTKEQYKKFSTVVHLLIGTNQKMNLFEYTIKAMLLRDLDIYFGLSKQLCVRYKALSSVWQPVVMVASFLAQSGHMEQNEISGAFSAAMLELNMSNPLLPASETTMDKFDQSLRILILAETCPALKKQIFSAFMACVWYDGVITPKEAGLIRAIAAMLAIPMPVLL
jgi:hypothetical protein